MADDKQAMLEKIRADMARTKERLAAMKASSSPSPSRPPTSVTARSPTVERSGSAGSGAGDDKAPAAATGAGSAPASGASDASSAGDGKDKEKEKKLSDAQAMIESLRAKKAAATSGAASTRSTATPAATGATLSPASAAAPDRQRRPTWASKTPEAGRGLTAAPTVGRGSGSGEAAGATASASVPSSAAGGAAGAADGAGGEKRGKNIRSLADLQAAIRKADHVKSKAQNQSQLEELRRQRQMRREARKTMTKEERVAYRKSVRQSLRMEQKKSEKKVGAQINSFMTMLQTLETEWAKQEEARFQKEQELLEIKSNLASCVAIGKVLENASHQMDHLKNVLDRLVTSMPPKVKKVDEKWSEDLVAFQSNYWQMRHTLYVQTAKHNKEMASLGESMGKELKLSNTPAAPAMPSPRSGPPGTAPPMPAAPAAAPVRQANPISALLSQIRGGTSLKKLDPEQVKREKAQRRAHIRKSMALLQDLQDTLTDALQTRQAAMLDSDEEDDEDYEGWSDEDDDE